MKFVCSKCRRVFDESDIIIDSLEVDYAHKLNFYCHECYTELSAKADEIVEKARSGKY